MHEPLERTSTNDGGERHAHVVKIFLTSAGMLRIQVPFQGRRAEFTDRIFGGISLTCNRVSC